MILGVLLSNIGLSGRGKSL